MAVDPSIILGVQAPKFDNMLDTAAKGMQMQQMGYQNQMQQRKMADDQATRQAYQAAMTAGPDGSPVLDQQKFTNTLAQQNPMLAHQKSQEFAAQEGAKAKAQMEVTKAHREESAGRLGAIIALPPEQKQAAWEAEIQRQIAAGAPSAANAPKQYPGDSVVYKGMVALMPAEKQIEQGNKEKEFAQKHEDHAIARQQMGSNKQNQALQQTQSILESARGNPEVGQALKDRYAAKKFEGLVDLYGDPNKLSPEQVQMAASEVAKIATGGVPTHSELQGLLPTSIPMGLAKLAATVSNNPQSAEAGEFVKRMGDYVGALKKDANGVIKEKFGRVIETRRGQLGDQHYKDLKAQYLDPLNEKPKAAGQAPVLKTHEIEW